MTPRRPGRRPARRWSRPAVPGEEVPPVAVGDALAAVGEELGLAAPGALAALTERWSDVVGAAVAAHATVRSLRAGVLTIAVDAAPWATQLRYLEADVLERVAELCGRDVVSSVRVVVTPPR